jgi:hypothetical protein
MRAQGLNEREEGPPGSMGGAPGCTSAQFRQASTSTFGSPATETAQLSSTHLYIPLP